MNFAPPSPEMDEKMSKVRAKWISRGLSQMRLIASHIRTEKQLASLSGFQLPEKTGEFFGVDADKMAAKFEGVHSTVKDD
jgi:hypothetical protein